MKKKIILMFSIIFIIWLSFGITDYFRVSSFEKPIFAFVGNNGADDGGSGVYQGLGYSFDIKGNFMPEDEFPGVTYYDYYLFGIQIESGIRD